MLISLKTHFILQIFCSHFDSGLNTYQFFFTVSMIYIGFLFDTAKKTKSLGKSDDIADQITKRLLFGWDS